MREEFVVPVYFYVRHFEGYDLVRICREQEVLVLAIPGLLLLLVCRHESVPRLPILFNLRILDLQTTAISNRACSLISSNLPEGLKIQEPGGLTG